MSRRLSTSFLHNLLLRQHNDPRDDPLDSRLSLDRSSDRGSSSELSTTSSSYSSGDTSLAREQLSSVAQLVQYMQALVVSSCTMFSGSFFRGHSSVTFPGNCTPTHPPLRNANNVEPYTFVTLFSGRSNTPHPPALRNT